MSAKRKILKIITVSSSAILMAGFVAFKAGAFSPYISSNNNVPPDSLKKDSLKAEDDMEYIHSSKSMIIHVPESVLVQPGDTISKDSELIPSSKSDQIFDINDMPFMGSSKSGVVFDPDDSLFDPPAQDTTKDSLKSTKEKPNTKINKKY